MTAFNMFNMASGDELGRYFASNVSDALNAMARNAGFENFGHICDSLPAIRDQIVVTEL